MLVGVLALVLGVVVHALVFVGARTLAGRLAGVSGVRFPVGVDPGYAKAPRVRRAIVFIAGPAASYLAASALCFVGIAVGGRARPDEATMRVVPVEQSPAWRAGVRAGDRVVTVDGEPVPSWDVLRARVAAQPPGVALDLELERQGERLHLSVQPVDGKIGVGAVTTRESVPVPEAAGAALVMPAQVLGMTVRILFSSVIGSKEVKTVGPVGMVRETAVISRDGLPTTLVFLGLLSSYYWPITFLAAFVANVIPRRSRAGGVAA